METGLLTILTILVAVLATLLILRHIREHREAQALSQMANSDAAQLLHMAGGRDYTEVSARLFDLLRDVCGCNKIIYLVRRNAYLEVNQSHGVTLPEEWNFSLPCTADLIALLTQSSTPGDVDDLSAVLPEGTGSQLRSLGAELYLPLIARGRLHGIYFLAGNGLIRSTRFRLVLASIAQNVSSAGHIRLIEAERSRLRRLVREMESGDRQPVARRSETGLLKLVRHRNSETLVERIIDEVGRDIGLDRYVFLYRQNGDGNPVKMLKRKSGGMDISPEKESLDRLMSRLAPDKLEEVASLPTAEPDGSPLISSLKQAGLKYAAEFPLSAAQSGLLVFDSDRYPDEVVSLLRGHGRAAAELMANAESFAEVEALSYTDGLTGLANQRYFKKRLDEEIGRAGRYGRSLGLIIFDLDELKSVNDSYGHQAGDSIIEQMGTTLKNTTRAIDVVARYGGDEFCIIMPESDEAICTRFMERLQRKVASTKFQLTQLGKEIHCTISLGGAVFPDHGDTPEKLIYAADMALLRAKEGGRDQYRLSS